MKKPKIHYKSGYKHQLEHRYKCTIPIRPIILVRSDYIRITPAGELIIKKGYAWDGPSGPTITTKTFMRGSLVHDALYQLMREGKLHDNCREIADNILRDICLQDGMSRMRAWYVHRGVRLGAGPAASPKNRKKVHSAP